MSLFHARGKEKKSNPWYCKGTIESSNYYFPYKSQSSETWRRSKARRNWIIIMLLFNCTAVHLGINQFDVIGTQDSRTAFKLVQDPPMEMWYMKVTHFNLSFKLDLQLKVSLLCELLLFSICHCVYMFLKGSKKVIFIQYKSKYRWTFWYNVGLLTFCQKNSIVLKRIQPALESDNA